MNTNEPIIKLTTPIPPASRHLPWNWLMRIVNKWVLGKYYGKLTLSFEQGKLTHVHEGRNRKPNDDQKVKEGDKVL